VWGSFSQAQGAPPLGELRLLFTIARAAVVQGPEVTDAWTEAGSTSGQRALRLGTSEAYCAVPPSGLQHAVGAGAVRNGRAGSGRAQPYSSGSAAVVPIRVSEGLGIALESSFQEGVKREVLRSLCQVQVLDGERVDKTIPFCFCLGRAGGSLCQVRILDGEKG
jgi:hypothetical protein